MTYEQTVEVQIILDANHTPTTEANLRFTAKERECTVYSSTKKPVKIKVTGPQNSGFLHDLCLRG
jgi:hypothetical protein